MDTFLQWQAGGTKKDCSKGILMGQRMSRTLSVHGISAGEAMGNARLMFPEVKLIVPKS